MAENEPEAAVGARAKLSEESALVADLVMSALAILHGSDAEVSLVGEFIGLAGVTGGIGISVLGQAEPEHLIGLADFFAGRLENAAKVFRRVANGESVESVMGTPNLAQLLDGEPDSGGVVLD